MYINPKAKLIFLGGTCGNNKWRQPFTAALLAGGVRPESIFDPVVADWTAEVQAREEQAKADATHMVFYLGSPFQEGNPLPAYSMVEATMALYDRPDKTVVVFDDGGITGQALKSFDQTRRVLAARHPKAQIFSGDEALNWLIGQFMAEA